MKTFVSILSALLLSTSASLAATTDHTTETNSIVTIGNPYIFVENGITFSVYPDGEFDFYIDDRVNLGANVNFGNTSITFNSGYNYDPYVQYDDYGAVLQIENVPIYYDYYGRVNQIGDISIYYSNGRVHRIGGMYVYYNSRGLFTHYTGYVNMYNRHFIYRPYYRYFVRPAVGFCLVYNKPYRRYYHPLRYSYYHPYAHNYRKSYARIGHAYNYDKAPRREQIYRNDKRVVSNNTGRRSPYVRSNQNTPVRKEEIAANRRSVKRQTIKANHTSRAAKQQERTAVTRRSDAPKRTVARSSATRASKPVQASKQRTVTQRTVTRGNGNQRVTRSSTISRKTAAPARSERSTASRTTVKQSQTRSPARSSRSVQSTKARSNSTRSH